MKLNTNEWEEFRLGDFCEITIAKSNDLSSLDKGNVPFIGRTEINNGLQDYVCSDRINKGNCITISMVGTNIALWQKNDFAASQNIAILRNENFNQIKAIFLCSLINFEMKNKFSYGRTVNKVDIENMILKLPICKDKTGQAIIDPSNKYSNQGYLPDFEWMEDYIKTLKYKPLTTKNTKKNPLSLDTNTWKDFKIKELFDIINGKGITQEEIQENPGSLYAIQSGETEEGCIGLIDEKYCNEKKYVVIKEPCLTVARSGSAGYIGFHSQSCVIGDSAKALLPKHKENFDTSVYLFFKTILMQLKQKYTYGRKVTTEKYLEETIKLPICLENDKITPIIDKSYKYSKDGYIPDFQFMKNYIKSLPYGDKI